MMLVIKNDDIWDTKPSSAYITHIIWADTALLLHRDTY